ncbi:hypothetical protein B0T24DRAFT_318909 [Lasiosphaeria ovina]|uniref:Secreted protein n=1 Tax=Lasiosphaeria ovina TaxID=92902 RepID=A0AAE0K789_9PEZI|nr:hypothetical protein B0T24DRAFT_318909 [Lasiosphaeria ovina]
MWWWWCPVVVVGAGCVAGSRGWDDCRARESSGERKLRNAGKVTGLRPVRCRGCGVGVGTRSGREDEPRAGPRAACN